MFEALKKTIGVCLICSRRNSITGVEKQPDKKKSLNNNK